MTPFTPKSAVRFAALFALRLGLIGAACQTGDPRPAETSVAQAKESADRPLCVMSFNIRYGTADDGPNAWDLRRDLVMQVIRASNADLIGLQEALRFQLDEIGQAFPEYAEIGVGRDDGVTRGEYAAILYRRDRFDRLDAGQFWLSETPTVPGSRSWKSACTRLCTWARLRDKASSEAFAFYNTHLDHQSEAARLGGVALILKRIRTSEANRPVILCGDFNAAEGSPPIQLIMESRAPGFRDTFRERNPRAIDMSTFHAWSGMTRGVKIDYLFATEGFRETESAEIVHLHDGNRYPSDHFPIVTVFKTR